MINQAYTALEHKLQLLGGLGDLDKELLFRHAEPLSVKKGQLLLAEGQRCSFIWFLYKGLLRSATYREGVVVNLSFHAEGSFATHLKSLRNQTPADFQIEAMEPAEVLAFNAEALFQLYKVSPAIESLGRRIVEELAMEQETQLQLFRLHTPTERYNYILQHQPWLLQRVSLTQLSSYLGISRETLSRIRKG